MEASHDSNGVLRKEVSHGRFKITMDGSMGECITRVALEELFPGYNFDKVRPYWLECLELDGYNEKLQIAFEYQGIQHFEYTPIFHGHGEEGLKKFQTQQERDARKLEILNFLGIVFIEITYHTKHEYIRDKVHNVVYDLGCEIVPLLPEELCSYDEFCQIVTDTQELPTKQLEKACEIAKSHGGECHSTAYLHAKANTLKFTCKHGHDFTTSLNAIGHLQNSERKRFCPECGGTRLKTKEEDRILAKQFGYILLETYFKIMGSPGNQRRVKRLIMLCPEGHDVDTTRDNFKPTKCGPQDKPRRGCSRCSHTKANRKKAEPRHYEEKGLECLDKKFVPRDELSHYRCLHCDNRFYEKWINITSRRDGYCLNCRSITK